MAPRPLKILLASPRGFCAGVVRAIDIVEQALARYGAPIYVRHEIVHNRHVVDDLRRKGAIFVKEVADIPVGAITVFSAHGVSRRVKGDAGLRDLQVVDATCPLVVKVHHEARRYASEGLELVLVGHAGHPEVEGTMGQVPGKVILVTSVEDALSIEPADPDKLAYVTQTTLSVDDTREIVRALKRRFPQISGPKAQDICYATQNRQGAVRGMVEKCDLVLVIGAEFSSNSSRLREVSESCGVPSYLIPDAEALDPDWLDNIETVGITAGASAPEFLVKGLIAKLGDLYDTTVEEVGSIRESVTFKLPRELTRLGRRGAPSA